MKNVGVIPEPDVFRHDLQPEDKFLILASDGVWEFIENQEAVEIVQSNLHLGAYAACQVLIQTAVKRWSDEEGDYRDDVRSPLSPSVCRSLLVDHGHRHRVATRLPNLSASRSAGLRNENHIPHNRDFVYRVSRVRSLLCI